MLVANDLDMLCEAMTLIKEKAEFKNLNSIEIVKLYRSFQWMDELKIRIQQSIEASKPNKVTPIKP